jgi:hypothetical protein
MEAVMTTDIDEHEASLRYARAEVARHRENGDTHIADELEQLVNTVYDYVNERGRWPVATVDADGTTRNPRRSSTRRGTAT